VRASLVVEIPDGWLEEHVARMWADYGDDPPAEGPKTPAEYLRSRLEDIASDELPIALWGWPVEVTVEGP